MYHPGSAERKVHAGQKTRLSNARTIVTPPQRLPLSTMVNGGGRSRMARARATITPIRLSTSTFTREREAHRDQSSEQGGDAPEAHVYD